MKLLKVLVIALLRGYWNVEAAIRLPATENPANVLIMHPIYAGSHEFVLRKFGEQLTELGHHVTQVRWKASNTVEVRNSTVNVVTMKVENSDMRYPYISADGTFYPPTHMLWERPARIWQVPFDVFRVMDAHCEALLNDSRLLERLRAANFTVAIVEVIGNECSLALLHRLGVPAIGFWGFALQGFEAKQMGMFQSPAIVPNLCSEVGSDMTFFQRVWNTLVMLAESALLNYHLHVMDRNIVKFMPGVPLSRKLLQEVNAVIVQANWYIDYPKLLPPHIDYVGCLQCGEPARPIPDHLNKFMSGGEAGTILFSLGVTGYNASTVPNNVMDCFLETFAALPHRVIIRYAPEKLTNVPENVLVVSWFPQHDLLADERTKLLVTHCGINSLNEAVYHGVPVVCLPIFFDQVDNGKRIIEKGIGLTLDRHRVTKEEVHSAIVTVLSEPRFRNTVIKYSGMWRREESSFQKARRWVEMVHNYGDLKHLRIPGGDFNILQYFAIDVFVFLILTSLTAAYLAYKCLWFALTHTFTGTKKEKCKQN